LQAQHAETNQKSNVRNYILQSQITKISMDDENFVKKYFLTAQKFEVNIDQATLLVQNDILVKIMAMP
jgi:hypothetical protein